MSLIIKYNDEFDVKHYPIEDTHRVVLEAVRKILNIKEDVEWWYQATIHGLCFWCSEKHFSKRRLLQEELAALANVNGLRWIELERGSNEVSVGISHVIYTVAVEGTTPTVLDSEFE